MRILLLILLPLLLSGCSIGLTRDPITGQTQTTVQGNLSLQDAKTIVKLLRNNRGAVKIRTWEQFLADNR